MCELWNIQNDEVATAWLNDKAVRKALHADDVRTQRVLCNRQSKYANRLSNDEFQCCSVMHQENVAGPWELCTGRIAYNHDAGSMIKYHKNLTARGYRALLYRYVSYIKTVKLG